MTVAELTDYIRQGIADRVITMHSAACISVKSMSGEIRSFHILSVGVDSDGSLFFQTWTAEEDEPPPKEEPPAKEEPAPKTTKKRRPKKS